MVLIFIILTSILGYCLVELQRGVYITYITITIYYQVVETMTNVNQGQGLQNPDYSKRIIRSY